MEKKKGSKKRSRVKYPNLDASVNAKTRREHYDFDYLDKLSDAELAWLDRFNKEYLSGNFSHTKDDLFQTKEQKKSCYDRNNARNRDIMTLAAAIGKLEYGYRTTGLDKDVDENQIITKIEDSEE